MNTFASARHGFRLGAAIATLVAFACSESSDALVQTNQIDEQGGVIRSADTQAELTFPAGALPTPRTITVTVQEPINIPRIVSKIYDFGPDGLVFDTPVTLRITGLTSTEELVIAQIVDGGAIPVPSSQWNPARGEVVAQFEHFSSYAAMVVYTPCAGRSCGDACTICDPLDPTCVEPPPSSKSCNQSGLCVDPALPICSDAGFVRIDAGFAADAAADAGIAPPDTGVPPDVGPVADTGVGVTCADTAFQRPQPRVDVLLVIDKTGSMGEEQAALAANFPLLEQTLSQNNADFHLGVTTTDTDDEQGRLVGTPAILTSSTANITTLFASRVQFTLTGGAPPDESGLLAAQQSLTAATGFHRPGSALTIIFMSDEPDQSPSPVQFYLSALRAAKGPYGERRLQLNHITGPNVQSCSGVGGNAGAAPRYHEAGRQTNGVYSDICVPPYSQALTDLGPSDYGYEFVFDISRTLTSSASVEVRVDGRTTTDWTYDGTLNAVVFPETNVPPPSARVEIRYPCP